MRRQRGATLVLTALTLTALLGMAALVVDQGTMCLARQRAQDAADAAALAGGALLPNTTGAAAVAQQVTAANTPDDGGFLVTGITSPTTVTRDDGSSLTVRAGESLLVQGHVDVPMPFGPAIGFAPTSQAGTPDTLSVTAQAAVVQQTACGLPAGVGLAPFALIGDEPNSSDPTARYVATLLSTANGARTPQPGVYQPTTQFGGQPLVLRENVWSNGVLVDQGNFDPVLLGGVQGYTSSINHTSDTPLVTGQSLSPQSSETIHLTQEYLGARLSPSATPFTHDYPTSPVYVNWFFGGQSLPVDTSQTPVTDPNTGQSYAYHMDPHRQELTDAHVLILPVVSQSVQNGTGPVTVLAFAAFFVEQTYSSSSNNAIAQGRFIGLTLPGSGAGTCTGAGTDTAPQLVR